MARIVLDGLMGYGTQGLGSVGSVTINSVAYKINNISASRPVQEAKDYVPDGGPGRARYTIDFDECTIELQLATGSTVCPPFGSTFALTLDSGIGAETWIVMPNSPNQTNSAGDIRTVTITCKKAQGSVTTVA